MMKNFFRIIFTHFRKKTSYISAKIAEEEEEEHLTEVTETRRKNKNDENLLFYLCFYNQIG